MLNLVASAASMSTAVETTTAMEASARSAATMESTATTESISTVKALTSKSAAVEAFTSEAATVETSAVKAAIEASMEAAVEAAMKTAIKETITVAEAKAPPWSGSEEDAAIEPFRAVIAVGSAGIGIIAVISIGAVRWTVINRSAKSNAEGDALSVGVGS